MYSERKNLDLAAVGRAILERWKDAGVFERSVELRQGAPRFVFFEGPPSANGLPGIHHVMARSIKDAICRYKTQRGYLVERKAGWDTHGLPVELGVETMLGITKEDIGKKISIEEYNQACRKEVMKYTDRWRDLTEQMGYWVDMDHPYVTYHNQYIESLWYLLKDLWNKGLLYRGKTIQPYSPAAGTGLSSHELNQPGCYRDVTDTSVTVLFPVVAEKGGTPKAQPAEVDGLPLYVMAWTTTPWTLSSNTALAVGERIDYEYIQTFNPYTGAPLVAIVAEPRLAAYFKPEGETAPMEAPKPNGLLPWRRLRKVAGKDLVGLHYAPVFDWVQPLGKAFEVIAGDFVTTDDGTGIVHIAPTFGADDARVAKQIGISPMVVRTATGAEEPLVDKKGRFYLLEELDAEFVRQYVNSAKYGEWAGHYVKPDYTGADDPMGGDVNVDLCVELKKEGKAFRIEKYKHSYPHCWRTDKPVLYYPLDSWFIRTTALKDRLIALNRTINWKPESTGSGRFGKWLENLVDWNLSRSRFWGTPLPVWATEDRSEMKCIGSVAELYQECEKAVKAGVMPKNPLGRFKPGDMGQENYDSIDLHRPYVDSIVLVSDDGRAMHREPDLIDVWFDSGAMPYAQWHYPFENQEVFNQHFPADFIAEGVDQTRGWFFTLHAVATMVSDSVAFKNIISNGLVLDRNGNKMSKRLGNAVDPFEVIARQGADPLRWYMLSNSQPWENLKFDLAGVEEVVRKFFGTLHNTYSFFSLYANVDGFTPATPSIPTGKRAEMDRWVISRLNTLVREVTEAFDDYEPTKATRAIQEFVGEDLSNWYVRLNRKRYWGGGMTEDKLAAYQTLYTCLETVARLMAPVAPFYAEQLYSDLHPEAERAAHPQSVHLTDYPSADGTLIDGQLEKRMRMAQRITSLVLALRRKVAIKVRQPLARIMVPVLNEEFAHNLKAVEPVVLNELNVKSIEYLGADNTVIVKRVKPNFKVLGPRFGAQMKALAAVLDGLKQNEIVQFERQGELTVNLGDTKATVQLAEVEIVSDDIPGWEVASDGELTVALDVTLTDALREEGVAREVVNRVQNLRKESGLEVTDRIELFMATGSSETQAALKQQQEYISTQTLAVDAHFVSVLPPQTPSVEVELDAPYSNLLIGLARVNTTSTKN